MVSRKLAAPGPVSESARITSLDLIRGVAVLGILLMNAVHVKLGLVPYDNLSAGGSETWLDWSVGIFGEIFVDQKFMGLFLHAFRRWVAHVCRTCRGAGSASRVADSLAQHLAARLRHPATFWCGWVMY